MNVLNVKPLKVLACGAVAVALTVFGSYAFVTSTAVVRTAAHLVPTVASTATAASIHLAQAGASGLLQ
ncbi:MAG TPA: hypothetical protein VFS52_09420 [Steroidobacteraceae bacterium]|jgi:hypothetical protein|nr:hypothetical protein [Steroidobacteraceae bacterium]